ncbi:hypothetical protein [Haladaptatus sp. DFWS20]|uniref:hypothetical protein n=1 Tax=Haladaptatus sp. DFWS20 TaxID=3403467 RepID=UPI003EC052E3
MTEQVDKNEELSDRFSTRSKPKNNSDSTEDAKDTGDKSDPGEVKDTSDTDGTGGMGGTGHTGEADDQGTVKKVQDADDTGHTDGADDTENAGHTGNTGHTKNTDSTRNRTQYVMYLPDDLQEELNNLYDQYNGQSLINGNGGIEKHKDFLEGLVRAGLENDDLDEYIGVKGQSK